METLQIAVMLACFPLSYSNLAFIWLKLCLVLRPPKNFSHWKLHQQRQQQLLLFKVSSVLTIYHDLSIGSYSLCQHTHCVNAIVFFVLKLLQPSVHLPISQLSSPQLLSPQLPTNYQATLQSISIDYLGLQTLKSSARSA